MSGETGRQKEEKAARKWVCMDINMGIKLAALPSLYLWNGLQSDSPLHVTWFYPDLIFHHILSCLLLPFFYLPHEGQTLNATFEGIDEQGLRSRPITKCWFCLFVTQSTFSSHYIFRLAGKIKSEVWNASQTKILMMNNLDCKFFLIFT